MRYQWISVLFLLPALPLASGDLATPRWDDMRLKHSWYTIPKNWECLGPPPAGTMIDLHVALKPNFENALVNVLSEISSPRHPKYRAHLSKAEVAELVAPHPDTFELVHSWLEYHRVLSTSVSAKHGGSFLTLIRMPISQANDLLGASYQLYTHTETNKTIIRTVGYSLPAALHGHVQTVAPTTYFVSPLTQQQTRRKRPVRAAAGLVKSAWGGPVMVPASREDVGAITPPFLRWLYSTFAYMPTATDRNLLGIAGHSGDYPSPADLATFMRKYRSEGTDATFTVVPVNGGGYDPSNPGIEASADLQLTEGIAYPTPHIYYSIAPAPDNDLYVVWLISILSQESIPPTITSSYGTYEELCPVDYAMYVCFLFAQLAARGVSVLLTSGDYGVGEGDCKTEDDTVQFSPLFPATCPWVTAVGGTMRTMPEVAASFSGGGFSNYFLRPSYQQQAVSTFLQALGRQYYGQYNPWGRGIPDIAAQAEGIRYFLNGDEYILDGTSCSTPIVAGIISLLNDHLLSEGKAPLGFLNPWLYDGGLVGLNDITSGSNPGCDTDGFSAIAGWDPVTGLGTPDFEHLLYILDLANFSNSAN